MVKSKGIITEFQREILVSFSTLPDAYNFYLTGGTALSDFYLGHRRSFDLDLFTAEKNIILPFSRVFEEELKKKYNLAVIRRFETFVEFELRKIDDSVRVQFAFDTPFRFEEPVNSDLGVKVNDYKDLIVDKFLAFFGRAEPRDAVDLFFILKRERFEETARLALQKDPGFDLYWLAVALQKVKNFPDDIERWPVEMIEKININELKILFSNLSKEIMDKIKETKLSH